MDAVLSELIEFLKTASPMIWETLSRQVYLEMIQFIVWGTLIAIAGLVLLVFARYLRNKAKQINDRFDILDYKFGFWLAFPIGIVFLGGALSMFMSALNRYLNPDFYVIQLILEQLK